MGNIQGNIQKGQNIFEENNLLINQKVIGNPSHLSIFKEEEDNSFSNSDNYNPKEESKSSKEENIVIISNEHHSNDNNKEEISPKDDIKKENDENKIYEKSSSLNNNNIGPIVTSNLMNNLSTKSQNEDKFECSVLEKLKSLNMEIDLDDQVVEKENNDVTEEVVEEKVFRKSKNKRAKIDVEE